MNMGFHKSLGAELQQFRQSSQECGSERLADAPSISRPNRLKQLVWVLLAVAFAYLLTTLSAVLLWVLAAVAVGAIALATAVCIYAQNNTW
jgi:type VI protein secretion system component VasF